MLCVLCISCPNIWRFLDVDFSPLMNRENLSIEDKINLHLEDQVSNEFILTLSPIVYVFLVVSKCMLSQDIWTKLEVDHDSEELS
jgi:hypothetical protein